jgi:hypothetical protein
MTGRNGMHLIRIRGTVDVPDRGLLLGNGGTR